MKTARQLFNTYWLPLAFVLAVIMRLTALGRYVTPDEGAWVFWSLNFREALLAGDWANTFQTSHPGVTTMWLGAFAIQLQQAAFAETLAWLEKLIWLTPDYGEPARALYQFLPITRVVFATATSLGIVAIGWIVERDFGRNAAILTTFALALDPFIAGLSGLPMTDPLLATFTTLVLLGLHRLTKQPSIHLYTLIGIGTALAILSKLPGVLLLGFVPLAMLVIFWRRWLTLLQAGAVWGVAIVGTILIVLPAAWGAPQHILSVLQSSGGAETSLSIPIFFLGENRFDVGWGFYPLLLIYRLAPVAFVGLWFSFGRKQTRSLALWLLLFSILFIIGLEQSVRVFDRYIVPLTMAWTILATIALGAYADRKINLRFAICDLRTVLLSIMVLFGLLNMRLPLFAYNTLLGGLPVAQRLLPTGWGEAESIAARQFHTICPETEAIVVSNVPAVAPFFAGATYKASSTATHVSPHLKGSLEPLATKTALETQPDHVVQVAGKFVALYCDRSFAHNQVASRLPVEAVFDRAASLVGFTPVYGEPTTNELIVEMGWQGINSAEFAEFDIEIALLDANGQPQAARTIPLVDNNGLPAKYWTTGQTQELHTILIVPQDQPAGEYQLVLSLFDSAGARRGVFFPSTETWNVNVPIGTVTLPIESDSR